MTGQLQSQQSRWKHKNWAIGTFQPYKSPGLDGISPAFLQQGQAKLLPILRKVLISSLALGYIPSAWSRARVVFIPKTGKKDITNPKSFRPISLKSFDEMSRGDMVAKGHHLNFRYESILVSGLKETKKAELVENSAPAESKAPVLATQSPPPANKSVPCKLGHSEMLEDLAEDEDLLDLTVVGKMEGGLPCHRRSSRRSSRTAAWMKRT